MVAGVVFDVAVELKYKLTSIQHRQRQAASLVVVAAVTARQRASCDGRASRDPVPSRALHAQSGARFM